MFEKLFIIFAHIWICWKSIFTKVNFDNKLLTWFEIYSMTPLGSYREKLAFKKVVNLYSEQNGDKLKEIFPDYNPPDLLRKIGFHNAQAYLRNARAILIRSKIANSDLFEDGEPSEAAIKKSELYIEKHVQWTNLIFSFPNSQEEKNALNELQKLGEINIPQMKIGNYLITIK